MPRVISAFKQFLDGEGNPLISGWLKFTVSGTNNTDKNTYADSGETIPNTNPLQLDAEGRCPDAFGTGSYRVVSFTNDPIGNVPAEQIQQKDPVPGNVDGAGEWSAWNATTPYSEGSIRVADNGRYYKSLQGENEGNDPTDPLNEQFWEEIRLISIYNQTKPYVEKDPIIFVDDIQYICIEATLAGENPTTNPEKWRSLYIDAYTKKESNELMITHTLLI